MNDAPTLWHKLLSLRYAAELAWSERRGRFRRACAAVPVGALAALAPPAAARVSDLARRYAVAFEQSQDREGSLQAYEYLDFLDQMLAACEVAASRGGIVHDVGCASFAYAGALCAFFAPERLVGFELEGYRRLKGGVNRAERAAANVAPLAVASFVIADYAAQAGQAAVITAFFPFVTPGPVLGWRLPLSVLRPAALFARIAANLKPSGALWMVNHSEFEFPVAAGHATDAGLRLVARHRCTPTIRARRHAPVASVWTVQT